MIRVIEHKLYPTASQAAKLTEWLSVCCWIYNRALEHRVKAYARRGESPSMYDQCHLLTGWRGRIDGIRLIPAHFERGALRRVDRGMQAFFRRCKAGEKPGFPRFKSRHRYNSLEHIAPGQYIRDGRIFVPGLSLVLARGRFAPEGDQKGIRIIRRASGWYAQVIIHDGQTAPAKRPVRTSVGVDVGLSAFATLSTGERIENPRFARRSERKLRAAQRRLSRRVKGSRRRREAVRRLRRVHERVAAQRRAFAHQASTDLVRRFDLIAIEDLNVKGLGRSRLSKSIMDAGWSIFTQELERKAEWAGATVVRVDPRGTSQECPGCGALAKKKLRERTHACSCGLVLDRDEAAARVILSRALVVAGAERPWRDPTAGDGLVARGQVGPVKRDRSTDLLPNEPDTRYEAALPKGRS